MPCSTWNTAAPSPVVFDLLLGTSFELILVSYPLQSLILDDLIETLFINIFYAGKIAAMKPKQSFFNGTLDIIRPLSYVEKDDIKRFSCTMGMPEFVNPCPSAETTKRGEIRRMLDRMYRQNKHIKGNIFRAMGNIARDYLLETPS